MDILKCILVLCFINFGAIGFVFGLNSSPNYKYSFEQCLITKPMSLATCLGVGALSQLQSIDDDPQYNVLDGITLLRDEQLPRNFGNFLERDPTNFRMIVDSLGSLISARTIHYDMSGIYPGLLMRVTPSANGELEFIMDPHQESIDSLKTVQEIGTGRLITRQIFLPMLLGLKFKVATLIPIIFGIIAIIAKKALFLSKIALVVSTSIALGSVMFGYGGYGGYGGYYGGPGGHYPTHHHGGIGAGHGFGFHPGAYKVSDELNTGEYNNENRFRGFNNEFPQDQLNFNPPEFDRKRKVQDGRNFAWNDNEKDLLQTNVK